MKLVAAFKKWVVPGTAQPVADAIDPGIALIMQELDEWLAGVETDLPDTKDGNLLTRLLGFGVRCSKVEIVGSRRRGKLEPGDIDVLYIPKSRLQVVEFMEQIADDERSIRQAGRAWRCVVGGQQVDFIESTEKTWGIDIVIFTGSRGFKQRLFRHAERRGYRIESEKIVKGQEGHYGNYFVAAFDHWTEEKILTHLGLTDFLDPRKRELPEDAVPTPPFYLPTPSPAIEAPSQPTTSYDPYYPGDSEYP